MRFGRVDRLVLFGGAPLLAEFVKYVSGTKWPCVVFTSKRHLEEVVDKNGTTFENILKQVKATYFSSDDINSDKNLSKYIAKTTLGIAFGAAWPFSQKTIDQFGGRLLDVMGINLPKYRGGAHYTWKILRSDREMAVNLQIVREKMHSGPVIKHTEYILPEHAKIPKDYFELAVKHELEFLKEFLGDLSSDKDFGLTELNETHSLHMPFLHTKTQAFIDWEWSANEIEKFICAFDDPYAGASTFFNGARIFLKKCTLAEEDSKFHPFAAGVVYRKNSSGLFIAAKDNAICVKEIADEKGNDITSKIMLGNRLWTPREYLDFAMEFNASYGAKGVKKK